MAGGVVDLPTGHRLVVPRCGIRSYSSTPPICQDNFYVPAQVVSSLPAKAEAQVQPQSNTCEVCRGRSGNGMGCSSSASVFLCR